MKSSKIASLVLAGTLLAGSASSCKKDLLNPVNPDQPSTANFWQTSSDATRAVTAMYSDLQYYSEYSLYWHFATEGRSDESWTNTPDPGLNMFLIFRQTNTLDQRSANMWNDMYRGIFRCNQILTYVPAIDMDAMLKKRLLAEAHFVRGLLYYDLSLLFGNVPLNLTLADATTRVPQVTIDQTQAQIILDLEAAKPDLPLAKDYSAADKGRATRGAAAALEGKVYMQQKNWAMASAQFAEIISSGQYALVPNFQDNFTEFNENNNESIFEVQFSPTSKVSAPGIDIAGGGEGNERAQFWGPPGIGFTDVEVRPWVFQEFTDKTAAGGTDPRRNVTMYSAVGTPLVYGRPFGPGTNGLNINPARYTWRKYQNDPRLGGGNFEDFFSGINIRLIRYADVLLMQAEALNEQGQPASALPLINQVRTRAGVTQLTAALSQTDMRTQLRHERIVELAGEGMRWSDINRYGLLDSQAEVTKLAQSNHDPDFNNFVVGKNRLLPIPQTDLDIDKSLKQNPGF